MTINTIGTIASVALVMLSAPAFAQDRVAALVCQDESGCRNIPNYRFDAGHTAGGIFQITDTNWRFYAPQLDIDIEKYPNAMSAPEHEQGQVFGLMWAREGSRPWTCCNAKLTRHLNTINGTRAGNASGMMRAQFDPKAHAPPEPTHQWRESYDNPSSPPRQIRRHVWYESDGNGLPVETTRKEYE